MERRNFIATLVALPALGLLVACGSDATGDSLATAETTAEAPPSDTAAPSTEPAAPAETDVPAVLSDDPVLSYTSPGGFTTREFAFQNPPTVLVTKDGMLITAGVSPAIFPGPLLPQHQAQTVSPAGVDALLAAAESAGLLADVDYTSDDGLLIADASTATPAFIGPGSDRRHHHGRWRGASATGLLRHGRR